MKKALIVVAVLAGILLVFQVRSFKKVDSILQRSEQQIVLSELRTLQLANEQLRKQLDEARVAFEEIQSKLAKETIDDEINRLTLLAGEESVVGMGVEITLSDVVDTFWISDLVAQLVGSGAEAIAINDVRMTPRTAGLRTVSGGLLMRRKFFKAPLRIIAIGPSKELKDAVSQGGGIIDRLKSAYPKGAVLIAEREKIVIPALSEE